MSKRYAKCLHMKSTLTYIHDYSPTLYYCTVQKFDGENVDEYFIRDYHMITSVVILPGCLGANYR